MKSYHEYPEFVVEARDMDGKVYASASLVSSADAYTSLYDTYIGYSWARGFYDFSRTAPRLPHNLSVGLKGCATYPIEVVLEWARAGIRLLPEQIAELAA